MESLMKLTELEIVKERPNNTANLTIHKQGADFKFIINESTGRIEKHCDDGRVEPVTVDYYDNWGYD